MCERFSKIAVRRNTGLHRASSLSAQSFTNRPSLSMATLRPLASLLGAILAGPILAQTPVVSPVAPRPTPVQITPAPIDPPVDAGPAPIPGTVNTVPGVPVTPGSPVTPGVPTTAGPAGPAGAGEGNNSLQPVVEFQGDELGLVLRTLARQAGISIMVSEKVQGTVTVRLVDTTPRDAIAAIVESKGLVMVQKGNVYSVKTQEEKTKEPAEPGSYTFGYATAEKIQPLLDKQLTSGQPSQFDARTNTIFFRETKNSMDKVMLFLQTVDRPTEQVMIEARLVEVTANPQQNFGINWGGVVGGSTAQVFRYGGSTLGSSTISSQTNPQTGQVNPVVTPSTLPAVLTNTSTGQLQSQDFLFGGLGTAANAGKLLGSQFAILSAPQLALTLRLLNEDQDAEFLANPRVVTANNQKAEIKITRAQPVPQLTFNEQTAQAVFSGFQDKEFGNTLIVTPVINKENYVSMNVKPEISNKVGDINFTFAGGASVTSPVIDKRTLESNVVIKSGDTLAIGGLLQDELRKGRTKVPVLGDIPGVGYLFQEHTNSRTKRNLLVFVTPTIIKQGYGTGLESQVSGLHSSGDEFADPNGWRNNAKGAVRLVPTSRRQVAADYPKPGVAPVPKRRGVKTVVQTTETKEEAQ